MDYKAAMLFWLQNAQTSPCARGISGNRQMLDRIKTVLVVGHLQHLRVFLLVKSLIKLLLLFIFFFVIYIEPHFCYISRFQNILILVLFVLHCNMDKQLFMSLG